MRNDLNIPGLYHLGPSDFLQFNATNSRTTAIDLQIRGSYFMDGNLEESRPLWEKLTIGANSTSGISIALGNSWLQSIDVCVLNANDVQCGDVLASVQILRGSIGPSLPRYALATLIEDYVYSDYDSAWPLLTGRGPNPDNWSITVIEPASPAAGAEFLYTVPARTRMKLNSIRFGLVCDATVANRLPSIVIDSGGATTILARFSSQTVVAGGATQIYSFVAGYPISNVILPAAEVQDQLPDNIVLYPGCRIRTITNSLQAGDQYQMGAMWTRTQCMRITA